MPSAPLAPQTITPSPLNATTPPAAFAEPLTSNEAFYVRTHFGVPSVEISNWKLKVGGAVANAFALSLADLRALPQRTLTVTLECAGNGRRRMDPPVGGVPWNDYAVGTAEWKGASLADVLRRAGLAPGVREILFRGADRGVEPEAGRSMAFERSLPVKDALHPQVLIAVEMNGQPLPLDHGAPARLIVPGWYGMASVKWLSEIEAIEETFSGWFQKDRYVFRQGPDEVFPVGLMRVRSLITSPGEGTQLPIGRDVEIQGLAWAGASPVARVEVSVDGGQRWHSATLRPSRGLYAWRKFAWLWPHPSPGSHALVARAFDEQGNAQPLNPPHNEYGYGQNAVLPVKVTVADGS
jgi:DMSO/TMAO reductase YedYZ molybdopterin-dependent catalytic subunit